MEQNFIKNTREEEFDKQFFKKEGSAKDPSSDKTKFTKAEKRALKFAEK